MTDTNDMRRDFEALLVARGASTICQGDGYGYGDSLSQSFWVFWQVATERATAIERERCAAVCHRMKTVSGTDDVERGWNAAMRRVATAIRQGDTTSYSNYALRFMPLAP